MASIYCRKLNKLGQPLDEQPYPGVLGQRIVEQICEEAWQMWLDRQTMIINENRLDPLSLEDRAEIEAHMKAFLFNEKDETQKGGLPSGYTQQ
jgi:Fe-S cluster biosynthesis and repair protein YggX